MYLYRWEATARHSAMSRSGSVPGAGALAVAGRQKAGLRQAVDLDVCVSGAYVSVASRLGAFEREDWLRLTGPGGVAPASSVARVARTLVGSTGSGAAHGSSP
jgi:hypothetical protein